MTIDNIFREFDALEFQDLCILLDPAIQRHADLPRPREYIRVFDSGFVVQMIRPHRRDSFHIVLFIAVEIS